MKKRNLPVIIGLLTAICILAFILGSSSGNSGSQGGHGWVERNGQQYYYLDSGTAATGWQTIDGLQYYFNSDGTMASGWLELDGKRYYLREKGSMVTGWLSLEGQRYYLGSDGAAAIGPTDVDGTVYLFDDSGLLASGLIEAEGKRYFSDDQGTPQSGWAEVDGTKYYFDENGCMATGWVSIGSFHYYFYEDGTPATGETVLNGKTWYFASNGQELPLVNPWNYVPEDYTVELTDINANHQIASIAYADFEEMMAACRDAGLNPAICSSYRTQEYQETLFTRKVNYYIGKGYDEQEAEELAGRSVAVPGTSEHQLGLALDIIDNSNWNLDESQAKTATQKWLMENSWKYGWILRYPDGKSEITGIIYEPWHYRYVGREVAAEIYEMDVCLEEYLDALTEAVG
ncbi:MAG: D-alanyl-D-alanine carboxypeptidase family protein [Oscillospiraceae bacterium]|nr:D-alanyl-D-alanine carboxypeptidase family protein [Oscillospiraceae bacterium]